MNKEERSALLQLADAIEKRGDYVLAIERLDVEIRMLASKVNKFKSPGDHKVQHTPIVEKETAQVMIEPTIKEESGKSLTCIQCGEQVAADNSIGCKDCGKPLHTNCKHEDCPEAD